MKPEIEKIIRPHYLTIEGYVSAGMESDKSTNTIFLNANENPYALPGLEKLNYYPQPQPVELLEAFSSKFNQLSTEHFCVTRGADEAIQILTRLCCEPHQDRILINTPAFGMYGVDAQLMPADVVSIPLIQANGTFTLDVEAIIKQGKNCKLVYLCSPNNPTGTAFPAEDMLKICTALEGYSLVVIDEAYIDFATATGSAISMSEYLFKHPNMIVLRTLSKSYSLAGERIGCMISGDTDFIALARAKGLDAYPLPLSSVKAACTALSPEMTDQVTANIQKLLSERKRMETELSKIGIIENIYPSAANFLLIKMKQASDFVKTCAEENIIIRDFSAKPGTENCIRLSIGTPADNNKVLEILNNF